MENKKVKIILTILLVTVILCALFFYLVWNGHIILNGFSANKYPVKGIDVSSYQGEINWQELSKENISFAFIKATEGSSFVDKNFKYNFSEARKTLLCVGAYHFFSFDSSGETQAENFIKNVEPFDGMLPPVIDVEFYGDKEQNPPDRNDVEIKLKALIKKLEEHYNQKPIIYATEKSYEYYLSDDYKDYDIWIRNVITKPNLSDGRSWTFWQYTNREKLKGYSGREEYIDMNVFCGTKAEFETYLKANTYKK